MERPRLDIDLRRRDVRCPFCHCAVERDADPVVCADCDARHHADCWREGGATCASCASPRGLGLLPVAPRKVDAAAPRGPRDPPDPVAFARYQELIGELRTHRDSYWLRQWWMFLVPHLYVPIFWPILWMAYQGEKRKVASLVEQVRTLARTYRLPVDDEALQVVQDSDAWAG